MLVLEEVKALLQLLVCLPQLLQLLQGLLSHCALLLLEDCESSSGCCPLFRELCAPVLQMVLLLGCHMKLFLQVPVSVYNLVILLLQLGVVCLQR
uniref:Uncharacterized protein n=1 Tax=Ixodes ricinus TaxID=34613 RepID=A0A6B0UD27_IXORI